MTRTERFYLGWILLGVILVGIHPAASQEPDSRLAYSSTLRIVAYDPISNFNLATTRLAAPDV